MSEEITFTTAAFGGFEKKQVLDYIYQIHEESDAEKARHKKKLEEISVAFKELEARALEAERNASTLGKDLAVSKEQIEEKDKTIENLNNIISQLNQRITQYEKIIAERQKKQQEKQQEKEIILPEPVPTIKTQPANQKPAETTDTDQEEIELKRQEIMAEYKKLEQSSAQIGRVMLDAHKKADSIMEAAKNQASSIVNQAKDSAEEHRVQANRVIAEHRNAVQQETENKIKEANQQAEAIIKEAEDKLETTKTSVENLTSQTTEQLEELKNQIVQLGQATANVIMEYKNEHFASSYNEDISNLDEDSSQPDEVSDSEELDKTVLEELELSLPKWESFFSDDNDDTDEMPEKAETVEQPPSTISFDTTDSFNKQLEEELSKYAFPSLDPPEKE